MKRISIGRSLTGFAAALMVAPFSAAEVIPPDTGFEQRQNAVLSELAGRFTPGRSYGDGEGTTFGRQTVYLLAGLQADRRGLSNGISVDEVQEEVTRLGEIAFEKLGTPGSPGPWSWRESGNPGVMHAAMALGHIAHQWADQLPTEALEAIRKAIEDSTWQGEASRYLVNGRTSVHAGELLLGERLGYDSALWHKARNMFDTMYERTMSHGGLEMNSPVYSAYHFAPLVLLQDIEDDEVRQKARILLEHSLLVNGHLSLPGGGTGAPRARDWGGGYLSTGAITRLYWQFFGSPSGSPSEATFHHITAAGDYRPSELLRSLYLDKGEGYSFWAYTDAPIGDTRKPHTVFHLGPDDVQVAPWEAVVMPDGEALLGINYGFRFQAIHVSMGVFARDDQGGYQVLYHAQPYVVGDTHDNPPGSLPSSTRTSPDTFRSEGYDFERLLYGRTMLSLWDPTLTYKEDGVVRTYQDTRVRLPDWSRHGGEMLQAGDWYVGRMGDSYIAYRPLGPKVEEEIRGGGSWIYMVLDGVSGCIVELATTDEFSSVEEYAAHLQERHFHFERTTEPWHIEFDARDPEDGELVRVRLDYRPQRRFIDGQELTMRQIDRGFMDSPWLEYDEATRTLTFEREGYGRIVYDIASATVDDRSGTGPGVLIPINEGADPRLLGGLRNFLASHQYRVTVTDQWANRTLTPEDIAEIESGYDLIYFPWEAMPAHYNDGQWGALDLPILVASPMLAGASDWKWTSGVDLASPEGTAFRVVEPGDQVLRKIDVADGIFDYRKDPIVLSTAVDPKEGRVILTKGTDPSRPALVWWEPEVLSESSHPRAFFNLHFEQYLDSANTGNSRPHPSTDMDGLTPAGKRLLLNTVEGLLGKGHHILLLTGKGRTHREGGVRRFLEEQGYQVTVSDEWANTPPGSDEIREIMRTYDMLYLTRSADGYAHSLWSGLNLPLLVSTPLRAVDWGWFSSHASADADSTTWFEVIEAEHPMLVDVAIAEDNRIDYRTDPVTAHSAQGEIAGEGTTVLEHGRDPADPAVMNLVTWDPDEFGSNAHPRTFFNMNFESLLDSENTTGDEGFAATNMDRLTDAGRHLYLNVIEQTLHPGGSREEADGFEAWRQENFSEEELDDPSISGMDADPGDYGIPNLLRYAFDLDPRVPERDGLVAVSVETVTEEGETAEYLTISFNRRLDPSDIVYVLEVSGDLMTWSSLEDYTIEDSLQGEKSERLTVRDSSPVESRTRRFLRVRIEYAPQ